MNKKILLSVISFFILASLITGCNGPETKDTNFVNESASEDNRILFGFCQEDYNWKYDFKATDEMIIQRADEICNGNIYVESSITEAYSCNIQDIDWNVKFTKSPGTFSLYLLALNPVSYLSQAYQLTGNDTYMNTAKDIISQWIRYKNSLESKENPYLWYDHGTAIRTNNLIYFLLSYTETGNYDQSFCNNLLEILSEHGKHLSNSDEYFENHNHGIFQDQALIYLSCFLDSPSSSEWLTLAKERVEAQKEYSFSDEMVHVENSPAYQIGVVELFYQIAEFLSSQNDNFGEELYADVMKSLEFMSWVTKPNGILAEIGDTSSLKDTLQKKDYSLEKYGNSHLSYAATLGEYGIQPDRLSAVYPKSGYYFGRSSWEKDSYTHSTWAMFKAGYLSKTHKHADDLSFMLYSKGYDIFVDPGWYNYMSGDKYRDYFISSHAHNTVIVDDKSYSPTVENSYKTGIFSYKEGDAWDEVLAYNNMYEGVSIDRHFVYGGDTIIIIDDIQSDIPHEYSQLFHLSEYMTIEASSDKEVIAAIGDSGFKVRIRQLGNSPSLNVVNGSDSNAQYGYLSRAMNDVQNINTLKWNIHADDTIFITIITIEDEEGYSTAGKNQSIYHGAQTEYDNLTDNIRLSVKTEDLIYHWEPRKKPSFDLISISLKGEKVTLQNNLPDTGDWNYAWYLIDAKTAEVIERIPYTDDTQAVFDLKMDGIYFIKAYESSVTGNQRASKMIAAVQKKGYRIENVTDQYPYLNLNYLGHSIEKTGKNKWKFTIHYNYSWNTSIAWYVYKDGGIFSSESIKDSNFVEYQFDEPGKYTVMYYLRTSNGDNEFWNFQQVIVE